MSIIEKIRAEVERLKGICTAQIKANPGQTFPFVMEMTGYDKLLAKLSDLEKEEKPMELDFEQELYKHFGQVKDFTLGMRIAKHFYELGCRRTAEKYDEIEYKRQRADVCEGLEEEVKRYYSDEYAYITGSQPTLSIVTNIARHFAQWGAEHARDEMMKEAVEVEVTETCGISSVWIKTKQFKPGQKVKIIIVKED